MWASVVLVVLGLGYAAYRVSLTLAAVRADRDGDPGRAEHLRGRAGYTFVGFIGVMTLAALVVAGVAIAGH